jgi:hypothetical protein
VSIGGEFPGVLVSNSYEFVKLMFAYIVTPVGDAPPLVPSQYLFNTLATQQYDGKVVTLSIAEPQVPDRWMISPAIIPDGVFTLTPLTEPAK